MSRTQLARELAAGHLSDRDALAFCAFVTSKTRAINDFIGHCGVPMESERQLLGLLLVAWFSGGTYVLEQKGAG